MAPAQDTKLCLAECPDQNPTKASGTKQLLGIASQPSSPRRRTAGSSIKTAFRQLLKSTLLKWRLVTPFPPFCGFPRKKSEGRVAVDSKKSPNPSLSQSTPLKEALRCTKIGSSPIFRPGPEVLVLPKMARSPSSLSARLALLIHWTSSTRSAAHTMRSSTKANTLFTIVCLGSITTSSAAMIIATVYGCGLLRGGAPVLNWVSKLRVARKVPGTVRPHGS
mmetsp:Transcript_70191/g.164330  ORF Transcript_70191/g.164330 Transcript_70191/m.164330 type:complete len:221 (-) Transcript_70191:640-1302(-)